MSERDQSCADRIAAHLTSREAALRLLTQRDAPEVTDDAEFALTWLDDAVSSYGVKLDDEDSAIVAGFRARFLATEGADIDGLIEDEDSSYAGETYADAFQGILSNVAEETEDDRDESLSSLPLGAGTTLILRVELSTGGPADYVTAVVDAEDRTVSEVTYHFADWFDHAETRVRDDSPLVAMMEQHAEYLDLPSQ